MRYSGFKKVHEDGQKAVLKHRNGSELRIAKANLSPKHLQDLKALPLYQADGDYDGKDDQARDPQSEPQPMPTNAPVTINISPNHSPAPGPTQAMAPTPQPSAPMHQPMQGEQPPPQTLAPQAQPPVEQQESIGSKVNNAIAQGEQNPQQRQEASVPQKTWNEPGDEMPVGNAPAEKPQLSPGQEYLQQMRLWTNDLNLHPKTYSDLLWGDKSPLGKIGSLFGIMLSSAGSGLTHQPNQLLALMDSQIERDFQAQKEDRSNKMNFAKLVDAHLLNKSLISKNTADVNHLALSDKVLNREFQLSKQRRAYVQGLYDKIVSQYPEGSKQRQDGMSLLGLMLQGVDAKDQSTAALFDSRAALYKDYQNALRGGTEGGTSSESDFQKQNATLRLMGQKDLADDIRSRHIPGVPGLGTEPVPAPQREEWKHLDNLEQSYNDAANYIKKVGVLGARLPSGLKAFGQSLGHRMELEIGQLEGLGRFTPEEAKRYKGMIPDLTGTHFTDQDISKVEALQREIKQHRNSILRSSGINGNKSQTNTDKSPQQYQDGTILRLQNGSRAIYQNGKPVRYNK